MAYKRVYSPKGEPFDVSEARANELILQHGWTQQPVIVEAVEEEKPKRTRRKKKEFVVDPAYVNPNASEPVEEPVEDSVPLEDIIDFGEKPVETD